MKIEIDAAEHAAMVRDADRYRWLRNLRNRNVGGRNITAGYPDDYALWGDDLDAAIDAALNQRWGDRG